MATGFMVNRKRSSDSGPPPTEAMWTGTTNEVHSKHDIFREMLNSYKEGYEQALSDLEDGIKTRLTNNFSSVTTLSVKIFKDAQKLFGVQPELLLKTEGISRYKLAIILPPAAFYSEKKQNFRKKLIDITFGKKERDFFLDFTLLADKETLNRDLLFSDGFTLQYVGTTKKKQPAKPVA